MDFSPIGKALPILAALAFFATCCGEMQEGAPDSSDSDSDTDSDSDSDSDSDTDTDTDAECECTSQDEDYCTLADNAMQCLDGCHFTETECWCADCTSCCTDGECVPSGCDDSPACESEAENYCVDETTLMECQVFTDVWDNHFAEVDCYDPVNCDCGSGCVEEEGIASCWCCQVDGGVGGPDASPDDSA